MTQAELICENLSRTAAGELCLADIPLSTLAQTYGTPLFVYDEARIRNRCRTYLGAMRLAFGEHAKVLYASKAASFRRLYEIMREEGMGVDVVSPGEIRTAELAGFPLENAYFHSNNKTDADIVYAMERGIGYFVVDNDAELYAIDRIAGERGVQQKILLRLTPGIDPHTYAAVATGKVDSKFGSAIETGQAEDITRAALACPNIDLYGFHCHIGSQVFDSETYLRAADIMLAFVANMAKTYGFHAKELNIGGGYGVRYTADQPTIDIAANIASVAAYLKARATELGIALPVICMEPGRSIVADAGLTLYSVGTVKRIPGYKTYVSVDGGMTDNPRYALYGSPYTIVPVVAHDGEKEPMTVAGRCCESGDILQENVALPADLARGDLLATLTTGAYNYSMSSNYNRIPRPAVVMLCENGLSALAVRRETPDDVAALDL